MISEQNELLNVVESILFVAGQSVSIGDIAEKLEIEKKQVEEVIELLKEKHKEDGINIITFKDSAQMCSNPKYAEDISTVLNPIREKQLTKAALETLAIVAYKQPITRTEIEQVRGVNSDYAMQVLTAFKLVEIVGRKDAVGKPLLYGTTDEFLKRFELQNIDDLPSYEEILERIKVIHEEDKKSDALYGSTEIIPEEELEDSKNKKEEESNVKRIDLNQIDEKETEENLTKISENEIKEKLLESNDGVFNSDSIIDNYKEDGVL